MFLFKFDGSPDPDSRFCWSIKDEGNVMIYKQSGPHDDATEDITAMECQQTRLAAVDVNYEIAPKCKKCMYTNLPISGI